MVTKTGLRRYGTKLLRRCHPMYNKALCGCRTQFTADRCSVRSSECERGIQPADVHEQRLLGCGVGRRVRRLEGSGRPLRSIAASAVNVVRPTAVQFVTLSVRDRCASANRHYCVLPCGESRVYIRGGAFDGWKAPLLRATPWWVTRREEAFDGWKAPLFRASPWWVTRRGGAFDGWKAVDGDNNTIAQMVGTASDSTHNLGSWSWSWQWQSSVFRSLFCRVCAWW